MAWGAQGGKGEEHRRARKRIREEGRRLREREALIMGGAARVAEGWTEGQGMPRGGEAQAVEELQGAWADLQRRLQRVGRADREGRRHRDLAQESGGPRVAPHYSHSGSRLSRRAGEGDAGEGMEADQGWGSEAGAEGQGAGETGAQGAGVGGGGGPRGALGCP